MPDSLGMVNFLNEAPIRGTQNQKQERASEASCAFNIIDIRIRILPLRHSSQPITLMCLYIPYWYSDPDPASISISNHCAAENSAESVLFRTKASYTQSNNIPTAAIKKARIAFVKSVVIVVLA